MAAVSSIIAGVGAAAAVGGVAVAAKGASDARKAANAAANKQAPQVDIPTLQAQTQNIAAENAANSAALERQYNPGAQELRAGSLQQLMDTLNPSQGAALNSLIANRSAQALLPSADNAALQARIKAQAGQPLTAQGFDSPLTRQAIAQAQSDLSLGGQLPLDVRNLIARQGLAKSGSVSQGLGLGRDIVARDLGLTSLDLQNQRLARAAQLGQQEMGLEQANAAMRSQAEQYGRNSLLQAQGIFANQDQQNASNYFNQAGLLQSIQNGDFARAYQAAQLGQSIAAPQSGLDPGSVGNIAIGNMNSAAGQQQNAAALQVGAANQRSALGGQLLGAGASLAGTFYRPSTPSGGSYYSPMVFNNNYSAPATAALPTSTFLKP